MKTLTKLLTMSAMVGTLALANPAAAATVVAGDTQPTQTNDCTPFCTPNLQTVYAASYFGGKPVLINSIGLYLNSNSNQSFSFTLSTSANSVGNLTSTFADNLTGDAASFFSGTVPASKDADGFTMFSGTPFSYDPSKGDLLVQINSNISDFSFDNTSSYASGASILAQRVYNFDPASGTGDVDGTGYAFNTKFETSVAGAVPEPAAWAMMLAGFGAVGFAMRRRQKTEVQVAYS